MIGFYGVLIHIPELAFYAEFLIKAHTNKEFEYVVSPDGVEGTAYICCNESHFVGRMREFMIEHGITTEAELRSTNQNDLNDFRSESCLRQVYEVNTRHAHSHASYRAGMDSDSLVYRWPAWRFVPESSLSDIPEELRYLDGIVVMKLDEAFWEQHADDPMIAIKEPWNPNGFSAYFRLVDVTREEAASLGLPVENVKRPAFNSEASQMFKSDPGLKNLLLKELRNMDTSVGKKLWIYAKEKNRKKSEDS